MADELLCCPFCGGTPERDNGWGGYMKCSNMQCVLGGPDDEALWISESAWNTRHQPNARAGVDLELRAAIDRLLPFLEHHESCGDHDAYNNAPVQTCGCGLDGAREHLISLIDQQGADRG